MQSLCAVLLLLSSLLVPLTNAQVQHPGQFKMSLLEKALLAPPTLRLPPLNNAELLVAAHLSAASTPGPIKVAQGVEMEDVGFGSGEWRNTTSEHRWTLCIESPGAITLSILFNEFFMPVGGEFYVSNGITTLGAFTQKNNNDDGKFAVAPLHGDTLTLTYLEPAGGVSGGPARLSVYKVVHGFNKAMLEEGSSGSCNVDVACPEGIHHMEQADSVGMVLTDDHQRYCSGALINNAKQDGTQYFLTANHCIFADVSYFIIGFKYQSTQCRRPGQKRTSVDTPQPKLVQGLRVVSTWDRTDYALLVIKERIPDDYDVFMAGFDSTLLPASDVYGIHHPSGDVKKISVYRGTVLPASWAEAPSTYHWQIPSWDAGVTERGSSGSPLFNKLGLIVGHLRGGQSSCDFQQGYDLYGALAFDWDYPERPEQRLATYLSAGKSAERHVRGRRLKTLRK